jgi:hypothetical protein
VISDDETVVATMRLPIETHALERTLAMLRVLYGEQLLLHQEGSFLVISRPPPA